LKLNASLVEVEWICLIVMQHRVQSVWLKKSISIKMAYLYRGTRDSCVTINCEYWNWNREQVTEEQDLQKIILLTLSHNP
jgi:hypothetical protein